MCGRVSYKEVRKTVRSGKGSGSRANSGVGAGVAAGGRAFTCLLDTVSLQAASASIPTAAIPAPPAQLHRRARPLRPLTLGFMVFVRPCDAPCFSAGFSEATSGPYLASSNAAPRRSPLLKGNGNLTSYPRPGQWPCRTSHCHTRDTANPPSRRSATHLKLIGKNEPRITTPPQSPFLIHSNSCIALTRKLIASPISCSIVHTKPVNFSPRVYSMFLGIIYLIR
jgi:hypothetical protein